MTQASPKIIYTLTDEAPALATHSFLPIIQAFAGACGVDVETRDISLAARIIANFPEQTDRSAADRRRAGGARRAGEDAATANIIKLPNISASIPTAEGSRSRELQAKGYDLPDYPDDPQSTEAEQRRGRPATTR